MSGICQKCGGDLSKYNYSARGTKKCKKCYLEYLRTRSNEERPKFNYKIMQQNILSRFWSKIEKTDNCWLWIANKNERGYGKFLITIQKDNQWIHKQVYAHRFSYELKNGIIPVGLVIDHICNNTSCVNPNHLQAITQRQNLERSEFFEGKKTHCPKGHEYNEENTYRNIKLRKRQCKICIRNYMYKRYYRLKHEGNKEY